MNETRLTAVSISVNQVLSGFERIDELKPDIIVDSGFKYGTRQYLGDDPDAFLGFGMLNATEKNIKDLEDKLNSSRLSYYYGGRMGVVLYAVKNGIPFFSVPNPDSDLSNLQQAANVNLNGGVDLRDHFDIVDENSPTYESLRSGEEESRLSGAQLFRKMEEESRIELEEERNRIERSRRSVARQLDVIAMKNPGTHILYSAFGSELVEPGNPSTYYGENIDPFFGSMGLECGGYMKEEDPFVDIPPVQSRVKKIDPENINIINSLFSIQDFFGNKIPEDPELREIINRGRVRLLS